MKKESLAQVFFCEFFETSKNTFHTELWKTEELWSNCFFTVKANWYKTDKRRQNQMVLQIFPNHR